jgi:hypothetical protein
MLNDIINLFMLSVIMLNVVMLSVVAPLVSGVLAKILKKILR